MADVEAENAATLETKLYEKFITEKRAGAPLINHI